MGSELGLIPSRTSRVPLPPTLKHAALTERIIGVYYEVYRELGHRFLESVYEEAFAVALRQNLLSFERQAPLNVWFRGVVVGEFKADFVVERAVLVELKSAKVIVEAYEAQLLNYLNATDLEIGLLFNFGLRPKFLRRVLDNERKAYRG